MITWFSCGSTATWLALPPEEFVREVLLERCAVRELVIGHDHGFGRGRSGDVETLRRLGATHGFAVDVVDPVDFGGQHVSSSRIRRAVAGGDLTSAAAMLGRPYGVVGRVGQGEQRGRLLGVPTINLSELSPRKLLPPDGVYAVRVEWRGGRAGGMMNQGPRPTFQDGRRVLEAHIFDFEGDLYGEWVRDRVGGAPPRHRTLRLGGAVAKAVAARSYPGPGGAGPGPANSRPRVTRLRA